MTIFNSFLYVYQAGLFFFLLKCSKPKMSSPTKHCGWWRTVFWCVSSLSPKQRMGPPVISVVIHQSTRDKKRWKTWVVGYDVHHAMVFTRIRDGWTHALRHTINLGKLGDLQQKRRFHGKIIYEFVFSIGPWKKMSVQNTHRADSRNSRPFPACAFFCPIPWSCGWVSLHPKSGYIQ